MSGLLSDTVLAALGVGPGIGTEDIGTDGIGDGADGAAPAGLCRVGDASPVRLCGRRSGRQVEIRLDTGATVTWVRAGVPDLQALGNGAGSFVVDAGAPPVGVATLAALPDATGVWRDVRVRCGAEGLVAFRRTGARAYLYDLWLLELLANALDGTALAPVDTATATPPYRAY